MALISIYKEGINMTEIHINYDTSKIQTVLNTVKDYNASALDQRGDNRNIAKLLVGNGLQLAIEGDPEIVGNNSIDGATEYLLTVVPEWCRDNDTLDSADNEQIKEMFNNYYSEMHLKKPSNCWISNLEVLVLEHDWSNMTSSIQSLKDFGDYLAGNLSVDFGNK